MTLDEAWSSSLTCELMPSLQDLDFKISIRYKSDVPGPDDPYKINPSQHPVGWVTEITIIKDKEYFIDEQRKGPYRIWHHEHHFKAVEGGVLMTDKLTRYWHDS